MKQKICPFAIVIFQIAAGLFIVDATGEVAFEMARLPCNIPGRVKD